MMSILDVNVGDKIKLLRHCPTLTQDKIYEVLEDVAGNFIILCDDHIFRPVNLDTYYWEKVENSKKENINFLELLKGY
jgi:hypothetical protein